MSPGDDQTALGRITDEVFRARAPLAKRSVIVSGHPTSVTLEAIYWDLLRQAADERGCSVNALVSEIDLLRTEAQTGNLSSAIRVWLVMHQMNTK